MFSVSQVIAMVPPCILATPGATTTGVGGMGLVAETWALVSVVLEEEEEEEAVA